MKLPFTAEQFYGVSVTYNESVWPAQWLLLALALKALALLGVLQDLGLVAAAAVGALRWRRLGCL